MFPILTRYGSIFIYTYTVVMALGILGAIGLTAWLSKKTKTSDWQEAIIIIFLAGIVGGRIGFVWFRWDYFQDQTAEVWRIWQGGLAYPTAFLAGLLALWIWALWHSGSFYATAGLLAPGLILVTFSGWLACWFEGCAYGREAANSLWTADLPDHLGIFALRLQPQLAGIVLSLVVFLPIVWAYKQWSPVIVFWLSLAAVSLIHLLAGLWRGDPAPMIGMLRLDTIIDGLLVLMAILMLVSTLSRRYLAGGTATA